MNPGRFYLPRMGASISPMMGANYLPTRGSIGLFGRITNSLKSINWSGLLSGANKTLNVVNQTIPLVRQAGPMFNNMRSMLRVAKLFGSETNSRNNTNNNNNNININNKSKNNVNSGNNSSINENLLIKKEELDNNYPNFFI